MNGQPCDCPGGGEEGEPGQGMGEGPGGGRRPKEANQTGNFKSRVRGKLQKGKIVIAGTADGENLTGRTTAEAREIINAEMNSKKETVENQLLPKSQREQRLGESFYVARLSESIPRHRSEACRVTYRFATDSLQLTETPFPQTPMSSFHNSGESLINCRISSMHSWSLITCKSTPRLRTYSSGPRKVLFSPTMMRGIL